MKVQFFMRCETCKHNPQIQSNLTVGFHTCNGFDWAGNLLNLISLSWVEKNAPSRPNLTHLYSC